MGKVLIVGASREVYVDGADFDAVICADGGYESALRLGLRPCALIGDGDSGGAGAEGVTVISLPADKDVTDLHACVDFALAAGYADITMTGVTGGRLDHFLSACGLLELIRDKGGRGRILDRENEIVPIDGSIALAPPHEYDYFSVIPSDREIVVSIAGARFPLCRATICRAGSLGVSNRPLDGHTAVVTVFEGNALLARSGRKAKYSS